MGRFKFRIGTKLGLTAGIGVVLVGGILLNQMLGNWSIAESNRLVGINYLNKGNAQATQTAMARAQIDALEIGSAPFRGDRDMARRRLDDGEFIEIHVATALSECERRDPKGLYARARAGELPNFTGIDQAYEAPQAPEIMIDTWNMSAEAACECIVTYLQQHRYL